MLYIGFNRSQMFCKDLVVSVISAATTNPGNADLFFFFCLFFFLPVRIFWYKFFHIFMFPLTT